MKRQFSLLLIALIIVGLATGVAVGCLQATTGGNEGGSDSNTSGRQTSSTGVQRQQDQGANGFQANGQAGNFGTIQNTSSSGFTLVSQDNQLQVVTNGDTKITKTSEVKVSELKIGDSITAVGSQQADGNLVASSIQVGVGGGFGAMGAGFANRTGQSGQGGQRGQNQGSGSGSQPQVTPWAGVQSSRGSIVNGSIEAIDGNTITVKAQSGSSSKVTTAAETNISRLAEGSLSDIKDGQASIVRGRNSDGTLEAASIQLVSGSTISAGR